MLSLRCHRYNAAFEAISFRFSADKLLALALPPLRPPSFPKATAAGFFFGFGRTTGSGWPVLLLTILAAIWLASLALLERLGILQLCAQAIRSQAGSPIRRFKLYHCPNFGAAELPVSLTGSFTLSKAMAFSSSP